MEDQRAQSFGDTETGRADFTYSTSLDGTQPTRIRLLTLSRLENHSDLHPIRCNLVEHDFNKQCPDYEALSYAWGTASEKTPILCNDKTFYVTKQLARALFALRNVDRRLWIDQICINQADDREKTVQVGIMSQIYRRSTTTIAWLDDQRRGIRQAFEVISRVRTASEKDIDSETAQKLTVEVARLGESNPSVETDDRYAISLNIFRLRYGNISWSDTHSVAKLTSNAWFSRRWIIQEAALCTNLLIVNAEVDGENRCRNQFSCPFEDLLLAYGVCLITSLARRRQSYFDPMMRLQVLAFMRAKCAKSQKLDFDLIQLLVMCRSFHNTDPRDRLFSLCGFSSDRSDLARIDPDYVAPASEVLATSIYRLIKSDNNLRLLEMSECSRRHNGVPSWVPYDRTIKDPDRLACSDLAALDLHTTMDAFFGLLGPKDGEKEQEDIGDVHGNADSDQTELKTYNSQRIKTHTVDESLLNEKIARLELTGGLGIRLRGRVIDRIARIGPVILNPATTVTMGFAQDDPEDLIRGIEDLERKSDARLENNRYTSPVIEIYLVTFGIIGLAISTWHRHFDAVAEMDTMVLERRGAFTYLTGEDLMTVYRITLCGGSDLEDLLNGHERDKVFRRWRHYQSGPQRLLEKVRTILHAPRRVGGFAGLAVVLMSILMGFVWNDRTMNLFRASLNVVGRRLAWTEDGLLALVPSRSAVGDSVVALDGAKLPFVLSPVNSEWEMIGPTYAHGLMDSQKLRENLDEDITIV